MPRGRKIIKSIEIEECTLGTASEEFYRHNRVKGLAEETQKTYRGYVGNFVKWCGEDTLLTEIHSKTLDSYICKKKEERRRK